MPMRWRCRPRTRAGSAGVVRLQADHVHHPATLARRSVGARGRGCAAPRRCCRRSACAGRGWRTGSWKMICIRRRYGRSAAPLSVVMSWPSKRIVPAVGSMSRSSSRPTVVLPQPDSPTSPRVSPRADVEADAIDRLDLGRRPLEDAALIGKCLTRSRTSTSGGAGPWSGLARRGSGDAASARSGASVLARGPGSPRLDVVVEPAADVVWPGDREQPGWTSMARVDVSSMRAGSAARTGSPRQVDQVRHVAGDDRELVLGPRRRPGSSRSGPGCRDGAAAGTASDVGLLDDLAGVHDRDPVAHLGDDAEVVGDEDDRGPGLVARLRIRSRICAWIVTSSAVVGSSAMSSSGSQARAIAIITRCAIPPDISCGYGLEPPLRVGDADHPQQLERPVSCAALRFMPRCSSRTSRDLRPTSQTGLSDDCRLLEDHADPVAADACASRRR